MTIKNDKISILLPLLLTALLTVSLSACTEQNVVISGGDGDSTGLEDPNQAPEENQNGDNQDPHNHYEDPGDDGHGHGPDPDAVSTPTSEITGSWRVARADDDAPLGYFDLMNLVGEDLVDGHFVMGLVPSEMLDGARGDLLEGTSWDGEELQIRWNPTSQSSERYTITSTNRIDDDRFEGHFEAELAPFSFDVTITRMNFDDLHEADEQ